MHLMLHSYTVGFKAVTKFEQNFGQMTHLVDFQSEHKRTPHLQQWCCMGLIVNILQAW